MNINNDTAGNAVPRAARSGRRWLLGAALVLAAGTAGAGLAGGVAMPHGHRGHAGLMAMEPAALDAHIDKMVAQCAPDASADQKVRLAAIARAAFADLRPVHARLREGHAQAHALLVAPVIDRAALERLRAAQMQQVDFISRRLLAAAEDAADVLAPEQRARFAGHLRAHMH